MKPSHLIFITILLLSLLVLPVTAKIGTNTVLYIPMNGTDFSTSFLDIAKGKTITASGVAQLNTTTKKFGSAAGNFSTNGYLTWTPTADDQFGSGDFTVATWVYITANPASAQYIYWHGNDGNFYNATYIAIGADRQISAAVYNSSGSDTTVYQYSYIPLNVWNYVVLSRNTTLGNLTLNVNGSINNPWPHSSKPMVGTIGAVYPGGEFNDIGAKFGTASRDSFFSGYIDDVVVMKGTAIDGTIVPAREYVSNPLAMFSQDKTTGTDPTTVTFTDLTEGPATGWAYYITNSTSTGGNGTALLKSTVQNPAIVFPIGNWSINQTVSNTLGTSYNNTKWVNITASGGGAVLPIAISSLSRTTIHPGWYTWFNDTSLNTPTSWDHYFGDGSVNITTQNGTKTYQRRGIYQACSIAGNTAGKNTSCNIIRVF